MPRKKKNTSQSNIRASVSKTQNIKKTLGYWFTVLFAIIAVVGLLLTALLPAIS